MSNDPATAPRYRGPELRLCPMCRVQIGYWMHEDGLCPLCAQVAKEAGE